jgi:DNA-cytosine methyltransferase
MKHGSLFSGIGGIDLGFEMAGIETSWTCEIDDWANGLLQKRFPNATHYRDVQEIGKDNLESVDIISGGFPCQDISTAGKGAGLDGKRSGLWFEMWRIICELQPRWVLIENVANLANKGGARVLHDLAEAGYDAEWQVISAKDVGARHLRKRLWIVAYKRELFNSIKQGLQGQLHSFEGESGNKVRRERIAENSIQGGSSNLPNSTKQRLQRHRRNSSLRIENVAKKSIQRGSSELSDASNKRLPGQLHNAKMQNRDEVGGGRTSKKTLQTRSSELSDTKSSRRRGGSSKECRDEQKGKFQQKKQKGSSIRSEVKRCNNVSTQTTSKGRTKQDIEKQNIRNGKFRIETFKILKDEPELDRVAYGLSQKVDRYNDRVKGLGNAVVPQIPYQLGKRIVTLNNLLEE